MESAILGNLPAEAVGSLFEKGNIVKNFKLVQTSTVMGETPDTPHLPIGWSNCPTWHSNLYYWWRPSALAESFGKLLAYQNMHRDSTCINPKIMIAHLYRWISTSKLKINIRFCIPDLDIDPICIYIESENYHTVTGLFF